LQCVVEQGNVDDVVVHGNGIAIKRNVANVTSNVSNGNVANVTINREVVGGVVGVRRSIGGGINSRLLVTGNISNAATNVME